MPCPSVILRIYPFLSLPCAERPLCEEHATIQASNINTHFLIPPVCVALSQETYSLLIDTFVRDKAEKAHLLNALETVPCVRAKADWALKHIESASRFAERLVAFAIVEVPTPRCPNPAAFTLTLDLTIARAFSSARRFARFSGSRRCVLR